MKYHKLLHKKPFWIWDIDEHKEEDIRTDGDCCFDHIIGLPQKEGNDKPLYDYQQIIFDSLATLIAYIVTSLCKYTQMIGWIFSGSMKLSRDNKNSKINKECDCPDSK
ncbi:MAG TPA: hypothetical protein VJ729_07065 [Nitrososphaeraceae archaeon]|nr:hypothetical protein [Nitrososphaeraceae archaeon]